MHILGFANGSLHGNSEILLKAALQAAAKSDPSITTSWVRAPGVSIPPNAAPVKGTMDVSLGKNQSHMSGSYAKDLPDDRPALINAILDADAIIVVTSTYSHSPAASMKVIMDRVGGPYMDAAFAKLALEKKAAGDEKFKNMPVDERLLKPRVVGLAAVGGSTTPDQFSMVLSQMHLYFQPLHAKVVDQFLAQGFSNPGAVLLDDSIVARAEELGKNVASQIGKSFEEAKYLGPIEPAACPNCHLSKFELFYTEDNAIGCVTCGTNGKLVGGPDGKIGAVWNDDCEYSAITWRGKLKHCFDIMKNSGRENSQMDEINQRREKWKDLPIDLVELPSSKL